MNIEDELNNLHGALYELYRGHSVDTEQIRKLWHRIDMLEAVKAKG